MTKQWRKKKEGSNEEFLVKNGLNAFHPLDTDNRYSGDSIDEHRGMEAANAYIAEKEIKQTFNNS